MKISFNHNGEVLTSQSIDTKEKVKEIFLKCKKDADINSLIFLYSGSEIDGNIIIGKIINRNDLERKKMNFIVLNKNNESNPCWINSKDIICPQCKESAKIDIKDYKIFFQCTKGGHNIGNIFLKNFENTQKIDISKIICDECKTNNKANSYKNLFYRCNNCKINLCIQCQNKHQNINPTHNFINYDDKNYICELHNEKFGAYCKTCEKNICLFCKKQHKIHELINYEDILPDLNDEKINIDKLRNVINEFKKVINDLVNRYNKIIENIEFYYEINKKLYNSINNKNINYEILYSFNKMNDIKIKSDMNESCKDNINKRIEKLNEIYDKMSNKTNNNELSNFIINKSDNQKNYQYQNNNRINKYNNQIPEQVYFLNSNDTNNQNGNNNYLHECNYYNSNNNKYNNYNNYSQQRNNTQNNYQNYDQNISKNQNKHQNNKNISNIPEKQKQSQNQ